MVFVSLQSKQTDDIARFAFVVLQKGDRSTGESILRIASRWSVIA